MKSRKLKIICAILFIMIIIFPVFTNPVNAAINKNYGNEKTKTLDPQLNKKVKQSAILDALGIFIYSVASIVENLVGNIFSSVSGDTDFPWADRIIFNTIPILDVNFFNAAEGSFYKTSSGQDTFMANIIRKTYFSVLSICIAFLTIIVAIAATKMALSALASEKAKYKEALTKWLFSIVLIFLMHNLMSFIFFVNEAMVEAASQILLKNLESDTLNETIMERLSPPISDLERVTNFVDQNSGLELGKLGLGTNYVAASLNPSATYPSILLGAIKDKFSKNEDINYIFADRKNYEIASVLLQDDEFQSTALPYASDASSGNGVATTIKEAWNHYFNQLKKTYDITNPATTNDKGGAVTVLATSVKRIIDNDPNDLDAIISKYDGKSDDEMVEEYKKGISWWDQLTGDEPIRKSTTLKFAKYELNVAKMLKKYRNSMFDSNGNYMGISNISNKQIDIIKSLAQFFKSSAYEYTKDNEGNYSGWRATKISVTSALLYAIFVAQSILYFFSYIKRFFYIVVLAIMAPVIVLFDFLGKALG